MQSRDYWTLIGWTLAAAVVVAVPFSHAGDADSSSPKKKCMSDLLKACGDRETRTSQSLSKLIDKLSDASKSDDPKQMKSALEEAKKSLSDLKSDHDKSGAALKKIHDRVESLRKQIKIAKHEHEKASSMVDDEDMDDIIWAY